MVGNLVKNFYLQNQITIKNPEELNQNLISKNHYEFLNQNENLILENVMTNDTFNKNLNSTLNDFSFSFLITF